MEDCHHSMTCTIKHANSCMSNTRTSKGDTAMGGRLMSPGNILQQRRRVCNIDVASIRQMKITSQKDINRSQMIQTVYKLQPYGCIFLVTCVCVRTYTHIAPHLYAFKVGVDIIQQNIFRVVSSLSSMSWKETFSPKVGENRTNTLQPRPDISY